MRIDRQKIGSAMIATLLLGSTTAAYPWPAWVRDQIYRMGYYATPEYIPLHAFNPNRVKQGEGLVPLAGLAPAAGWFYGTTSDPGTAYAMLPPVGRGKKWTELPLAPLADGTDARSTPIKATTIVGTEPNDIYKIALTRNGFVKTILYSFPIGEAPVTGLTAGPFGLLYGTAVGTLGSQGYVYAFDRATGVWSVVFVFTGGMGGDTPSGKLTAGRGGALYGGTAYGGNGNCSYAQGETGCGVVYRLAPPQWQGGAWTETVLHAFNGGADGAGPGSLVADGNGDLFGATVNGGNGQGMVFELAAGTGDQPGFSYASLYVFAGRNDGHTPNRQLGLDAGGAVYGVAQGGRYDLGTAFLLVPPYLQKHKWSFSLLHSFSGIGTDGATPVGGVVLDETGTVYGVTEQGGTYGAGSVYEIVP